MLIDRTLLDKIDKLINQYSILDIRKDFLNDNIDKLINKKDINLLAECGILLSESEKYKNRERALRIATLLVGLVQTTQYLTVANIIFNRLRNFAGQRLLEDEFDCNFSELLPPFEYMKETFNQKRNTVEIMEIKYTLNNFQLNFYDLIKKKANVSVSAPTSIGKSFIIKRILIDMINSECKNIVYIVPSRALINEVMNDIRVEMNKIDSDLKYYITCSSETKELDKTKRGIFILTQERFYQLCNNKDVEIDLIIVDEAQNVVDNGRGVILEYSIKYAKSIWKNVRIIFISPLITNPDIFLKKFSLNKSSEAYYEKDSLVSQKIIKLEKLMKGYKVTFNGQIVKDRVKINRGGVTKTIVNVLLGFNNGENSIVYCNTPDLTIKVCSQLYLSSNYPIIQNEELSDFADFVEHYIDKNYMLAQYIRRGIVFHYGDLPSFIRNGIEELAAKGLFKVIACTSTLLQGVNIPAQNIYVFNPHKGSDCELTNLEFWNLVGRAGRMGYDFCGNIILVQNEKWELINKYDSKESKISFASDRYKEINKLKDIFKNNVTDDKIQAEHLNNELDDYAKSSIIFDRINNNPIIDNIQDEEIDEYEKIVENIDEVLEEFTPPKQLLIKLLGLNSTNIQNMWNYFVENEKRIEEYIPLHPMHTDYERYISRYMQIITLINQHLMNSKLYDWDFEKLVFMSNAWMSEHSLKDIIFYKKKIGKNISTDEISSIIRQQIKYLNKNVRFILVKGMYAYQEILKEYLKYINKDDLIEKIPNIPLYLEFGASKQITVELISLGLMRDLAIELQNKLIIREKYLKADLKKIDLTNVTHNKYIINKLTDFIDSL